MTNKLELNYKQKELVIVLEDCLLLNLLSKSFLFGQNALKKEQILWQLWFFTKIHKWVPIQISTLIKGGKLKLWQKKQISQSTQVFPISTDSSPIEKMKQREKYKIYKSVLI